MKRDEEISRVSVSPELWLQMDDATREKFCCFQAKRLHSSKEITR